MEKNIASRGYILPKKVAKKVIVTELFTIYVYREDDYGTKYFEKRHKKTADIQKPQISAVNSVKICISPRR